MSFVKLTSKDLEVIIDISQHIVDYKVNALSVSRWQTFETEYLPRLVAQIADNQFRCFRIDDNTFTWLADQILHCRLYEAGVKRDNQTELAATAIGQAALKICDQASSGQRNYDRCQMHSNFAGLFEN